MGREFVPRSHHGFHVEMCGCICGSMLSFILVVQVRFWVLSFGVNTVIGDLVISASAKPFWTYDS